MASRRSPSPSPSIASVQSDVVSDMSPEEQSIRQFVKKRLSKRLFLGHYQERRYVDLIRAYRDMVVIHKSEEEFLQDVELVHSKLNKFYSFDKWIGITSPETVGVPVVGYCLWVKLQNLPFGFYWFQIRHIRYHDTDISLQLKVIRPVKEDVINPPISAINIQKTFSENVDALTSSLRSGIHALSKSLEKDTHAKCDISSSDGQSQSSSSQSSENKSNACNSDTINSKSDGTSGKSTNSTEADSLKFADFLVLLRFLFQNWKDILKLFVLAIVRFLNGTGFIIHYIGEFTLKFMNEVSKFCSAATPIVLAVIELFGKAIGGLYLLVAMIFSRRPSPSPIPRQPMGPQARVITWHDSRQPMSPQVREIAWSDSRTNNRNPWDRPQPSGYPPQS